MLQAVFCLGAGLLFLAIIARLGRIPAGRLWVLEAFVVGFAVRLGLMFVNEHYQFFEHKVAGNRSVEFYLKYIAGEGELWGLLRDQFSLQVIFNVPFFVMFGASLLTVTISNAFISALTAPLVGLMLHNPFGDRVARRGLLLFFIYPASFNFSLFGLRDPLIFFGMTLFAIGAISVYANHSRGLSLLISLAGAATALVLRPEMSYIIVALVGMLLRPTARRMIAADQRSIEKLATVGIFSVVALCCAGAMAAMSLKIAAAQIGASSINPLDLAGEAAEDRFSRAETMGVGGGTHLVSSESYVSMPVYLRIPLQTLGLIVLPFPWLIRGVAQLLAFADSMLLMGMIFCALKASFTGRRGALVAWGLLIAFAIGILGMGFIVSNAGNGFRMRFSVVPLLLLAGAFSRTIPVFSLRGK